MSISALRRVEADDVALLRRAARGDRRAHRIYSRRHAERALELVVVLTEDGADATLVASQVLTAAVAEGVAGDDALIRAAVRVTASIVSERGLGRLVVALTDGDGRTEDEVAALIGCTSAGVAELRTAAYAEVTPSQPVRTRECRGWPLVARRDRITPCESQAADGHLALCRQCRARLDEQRITRDKIRTRAGAVSAVVLADVVSLSVPAGGVAAGSGLASAVLGKAGMAIVGGTALVVTATSAGVAVARTSPPSPHRSHAPAVAPRHPHNSPAPSGAPQLRRRDAATTGAQSSGDNRTATPGVTQTTNSQSTTIAPPLPGATSLPSLPVAVPLPSSLPTLLPTPTTSTLLPPLPLPTVSSLLGH